MQDQNKLKQKLTSMGMGSVVGWDDLPAHRPWRVKMGFDPTAPDLHLGHAVGLFALRAMQDAGHQVVMIIGDFTASIGDPSGRNTLRPPLSAEVIKQNAKTYAEQAFKILDPAKTEVVFNSSWLEPMGAAGLIQLASQATVAQIAARDDFAKRLEQKVPIALHELLYPLLQAKDSVELNPDLETGGSDQLFNLLLGRELMRSNGQKPQACMMFNLLPGLDGQQKMSKSLGNHIGLTDGAPTIFAKSMSISDELMWQWMLCMGFAETPQVEQWKKEVQEKQTHPMHLKMNLSQWITARIDGEEAALNAKEMWVQTHQHKNAAASATAVQLELPAEGKPWSIVLREWGWCKSSTEARNRMEQGALKINGVALKDPKALLVPMESCLVTFGPKRVIRLETALASASAVSNASSSLGSEQESSTVGPDRSAKLKM